MRTIGIDDNAREAVAASVQLNMGSELNRKKRFTDDVSVGYKPTRETRHDSESHDSDARADSESHGSHGGHSGHVGHVGTTVTAVTVVTADTSASDPARRRRPEVRKVSRFQHRFGFESESSNHSVSDRARAPRARATPAQ